MKLFYIDEQDKRLFRILIACIVFLFITTPFKVSAETGSITITDAKNLNYALFPNLAQTASPSFGTVEVDVSDYTNIGNFRVTTNAFSFAQDFESTTFTCSGGATCTGVWWYDKNTTSVYYVFDGDPHVSSTPITLTFANNTVVGHVTASTGGACGNIGVNATAPVAIRATGICTSFFAVQYNNVVVSASTTDTYNVTYFSSGSGTGFNVTVNKGALPDKYFIHSSTQEFTRESTFNVVNFSYINSTYRDGLYLNATLSSGAYTSVLVNSSGVSVGNTTTPGVGGSVSGQIYFDYSNASLGSAYGINISLSSANFSSLNTYYIKTVDPLGNTVSGFPIDFSSQYYNTSRMWTFSSLGIYNSTLAFCSWYDIICKEEVLLTGFPDVSGSDPLTGRSHVIDVARVTINPIQYAYSITTDKDSYITGDIIHITAVNPSPSNTYVNMNLFIGGQNPIVDMLISPNTTKIINVTVSNDMLFGTWQVNLNTKQNGVGQVAVKMFTIGIPTVADKRLGLRWDVNNFVGDTNNLYYVTNDNSSTVRVYKVFPGSTTSTLADNFTASGSTSAFVPYLMDVPGYWNASITDNGNASNITYANMTVLVASAKIGCNKNLSDYVCWDKNSYNRGDAFVINYKATNIPSIVEVRLLILDPDNNNVLNKSICSTKLLAPNPCGNPQTGIFAKSFSSTAKFGKWHAILMIDGTATENYMDGSILADSYAIVVSRGGTEEGGVNNSVFTGSCGQNDVVCKIDGWTALFGLGVNDVSRFLFAVIIIAVMALFGFLAANNLYGGVTMGFIPFAFFTYINYVPRWFAVVLVILMAIRMRVFN